VANEISLTIKTQGHGKRHDDFKCKREYKQQINIKIAIVDVIDLHLIAALTENEASFSSCAYSHAWMDDKIFVRRSALCDAARRLLQRNSVYLSVWFMQLFCSHF